MKAIINGKIIRKDNIIENKILVFDNKIIGITDSLPNEDIEVIDAKGLYVSPGLIDIHIHGNKGYDTMTASKKELSLMSESIASTGVTSYLATTMTMDTKIIEDRLNTLREYINQDKFNGAKIIGIHLEGPFLNERYCGAQDPKFIVGPSFDMINKHSDIIKVITYAPEKDLNFEFTKYIKNNTDIVLSMGHTSASYEEAVEAIKHGASNATHLFNAMSGLNHRNPGVVGASVMNNVKCEIIADGIHTHTDIFKFLLKTKNIEDIILVTDAIEATGLADGIYTLGGQPIKVENNSARLVSNGALAGSTAKLNCMVKNFMKHTNLDIIQSINLASINPAVSIGIDDKKGSIEIGKDADIAIFDEELNCHMTIVEGNIKFKNGIL